MGRLKDTFVEIQQKKLETIQGMSIPDTLYYVNWDNEKPVRIQFHDYKERSNQLVFKTNTGRDYTISVDTVLRELMSPDSVYYTSVEKATQERIRYLKSRLEDNLRHIKNRQESIVEINKELAEYKEDVRDEL